MMPGAPQARVAFIRAHAWPARAEARHVGAIFAGAGHTAEIVKHARRLTLFTAGQCLVLPGDGVRPIWTPKQAAQIVLQRMPPGTPWVMADEPQPTLLT